MRHIPLKVVPSDIPRVPPLVYRGAIMQILYSPPAGGHILADQILPRHEVAQAVKALPDDATELILEEDQYKVLVQALKTFPWAINNEAIAEFVKEIYGIPKVNPNPAG